MGIEDLARKGMPQGQVGRYPSAELGFLRMDANTNLYGNNPAVERVARAIASLEANQYPSTPHSDPLREAIAVTHKVRIEQVIVGNGSDEILDLVTKAFLNPGDVVALVAPSFLMMKFYATVNLGRVVEVPLLAPGFGLDVDGLSAARAKLTILASPNNPTANAFAPEDLERVTTESQGIVLIDEAYAEYCGQNLLARATRTERLIVSRTFSKAYGLAGLRIGYAVAREEIVAKLAAVKPPFSVDLFAERAAIEALRDRSFVDASVEMVRAQGARLRERLGAMGLRPCRTDANFMLVDLGRPSDPIRAAIRRQGILVRDMADFPGLENYLRLTIGRQEHNAAFLVALEAALAEGA